MSGRADGDRAPPQKFRQRDYTASVRSAPTARQVLRSTAEGLRPLHNTFLKPFPDIAGNVFVQSSPSGDAPPASSGAPLPPPVPPQQALGLPHAGKHTQSEIPGSGGRKRSKKDLSHRYQPHASDAKSRLASGQGGGGSQQAFPTGGHDTESVGVVDLEPCPARLDESLHGDPLEKLEPEEATLAVKSAPGFLLCWVSQPNLFFNPSNDHDWSLYRVAASIALIEADENKGIVWQLSDGFRRYLPYYYKIYVQQEVEKMMLMIRLAVRRIVQPPSTHPAPDIQDDPDDKNFRQDVIRWHIWSLTVGSREIQTFRNFTRRRFGTDVPTPRVMAFMDNLNGEEDSIFDSQVVKEVLFEYFFGPNNTYGRAHSAKKFTPDRLYRLSIPFQALSLAAHLEWKTGYRIETQISPSVLNGYMDKIHEEVQKAAGSKHSKGKLNAMFEAWLRWGKEMYGLVPSPAQKTSVYFQGTNNILAKSFSRSYGAGDFSRYAPREFMRQFKAGCGPATTMEASDSWDTLDDVLASDSPPGGGPSTGPSSSQPGLGYGINLYGGPAGSHSHLGSHALTPDPGTGSGPSSSQAGPQNSTVGGYVPGPPGSTPEPQSQYDRQQQQAQSQFKSQFSSQYQHHQYDNQHQQGQAQYSGQQYHWQQPQGQTQDGGQQQQLQSQVSSQYQHHQYDNQRQQGQAQYSGQQYHWQQPQGRTQDGGQQQQLQSQVSSQYQHHQYDVQLQQTQTGDSSQQYHWQQPQGQTQDGGQQQQLQSQVSSQYQHRQYDVQQQQAQSQDSGQQYHWQQPQGRTQDGGQQQQLQSQVSSQYQHRQYDVQQQQAQSQDSGQQYHWQQPQGQTQDGGQQQQLQSQVSSQYQHRQYDVQQQQAQSQDSGQQYHWQQPQGQTQDGGQQQQLQSQVSSQYQHRQYDVQQQQAQTQDSSQQYYGQQQLVPSLYSSQYQQRQYDGQQQVQAQVSGQYQRRQYDGQQQEPQTQDSGLQQQVQTQYNSEYRQRQYGDQQQQNQLPMNITAPSQPLEHLPNIDVEHLQDLQDVLGPSGYTYGTSRWLGQQQQPPGQSQ